MVRPVRRKNHRGAFALVEAVVGTILLGVSLVVVIGLMGRAITSQRKGEELQIGAMLADEQLNLVLARGPDDYKRRFPIKGRCDEPFGRYEYTLDIGGGSASQPYVVRATISWMSGATAQSVVIETLMASRLGDEVDPEREPLEPVQRYQ